MKVYCTNPKCERWGVLDEVTKVRFTIRDGKPVLLNCDCPACGEPRTDVKQGGEIRANFGRFTSMSRDQKTASLKKRATAHYEQHIKPYKEHKNHEVMTEMRNLTTGKI